MNEDKQYQTQADCFNRCGGRITKVFNVGAEMYKFYRFKRLQLGPRR